MTRDRLNAQRAQSLRELQALLHVDGQRVAGRDALEHHIAAAAAALE